MSIESILLLIVSFLALSYSLFLKCRRWRFLGSNRKLPSSLGRTGGEVCNTLLSRQSLTYISVSLTTSKCSFFDRESQSISLKSSVYGNTTLYAVSIAAHEFGHAYCYQVRPFHSWLRDKIAPIVIIIGLIFLMVMLIACLLFSSKNVPVWSIKLLLILAISLYIFGSFIILRDEKYASQYGLRFLLLNSQVAKSEVSLVREFLWASYSTYIESTCFLSGAVCAFIFIYCILGNGFVIR